MLHDNLDLLLTILRKSSPTLSSPTPPSTRDPIASSNWSQNPSEKTASSAILLNMIFTSSSDIGGPNDAVDESDAVDNVRDDEAEESGGEAGIF